MKKLSILLFAMAFTPPAFAEAFKTGSYFVKETVLEERLTPNQKGKVKNKIYRLQKVDVLEVKGDWARVSKYYDGEAEGEIGLKSNITFFYIFKIYYGSCCNN